MGKAAVNAAKGLTVTNVVFEFPFSVSELITGL